MLDKSDIIQNDYNENVKAITDNEDADKLILENDNEYDENNVDSNNTTKNKNQYDNANSMLFNKHNKNNTLDNFVKKIHIEKNKIPEIIPRKRRINLKDPLLKIKGVNKGVNNNIINNYEKNNEKNPQECN
jgi:hypothetical protein